MGLEPPTRTTTFSSSTAQQLGLAAEAQVADLVQKQRAAGSQFELALPGFVSVGERPFFVAEQFALEQGFGDRRTVDGNERPLARRLR